jgi:hypothetical protein
MSSSLSSSNFTSVSGTNSKSNKQVGPATSGTASTAATSSTPSISSQVDKGKSVTSASTALAVFFGLTITYFIAKYYLVDRHMESRGSTATVVLLIYLVVTVGTQLFSNISLTSTICNGTPQVTTALAYTLLPNILIFGSLIVLLKVYPGWRAPFSNTLGYLVVLLMGVNDSLTDLLASKGSKLIQKICDDKSILINEMTHLNYKMYLETMSRDGLLVKNYDKLPAYKNLWALVGVKNSFADFIWYILTGALVISNTYNALLDITCKYSKQQKKSSADNYEAHKAAKHANKKKTTFFTMHD